MPSQSHRLDFCLLPRLQWKIVPPPAVIPPKPPRIIRFSHYRQKVPMFPRPMLVLATSTVLTIIVNQIVWFAWAKPKRERFREFYFGTAGVDEPEGEFLKAWMAQIPNFPTTAEEYDEMQQKQIVEIFPEPPLVPYDAPGWDRSKIGKFDLEEEKRKNLAPLNGNFILPFELFNSR